MNMRKLLCLLSAALLLFSCNDVDEFGQLLPDSVTLDTQDGLRAISDLTYDELEALVLPYEDQREEMRRNGGLLIRPTVVISRDQQRYDDMYVYYSSSEAGLPPYEGGYGYGDILTNSIGCYNEMAYISWNGDEQRQYLPGTTIYCKVGLSLWNGEQMPGFIDEVRDENYYNRTLYSEVHSYRYPDAAVISDFYLYEGDVIQGSFRVTPEISAASELPECGLCYSATNQLPTVDTDEIVEVSENYWDGMAYNVSAIIQDTAGTYYVRAFARGESGEISYSPVRRASCQGLMATTEIGEMINVSEMGYNALSEYLSALNVDEGVQDRIRSAGGLLIPTSFAIISGGSLMNWGLSAVTDEAELSQGSGTIDGGAEVVFIQYFPFLQTEALYWHPAEYYAEGDTATTYYYQSGMEVSGSMNTVWGYSDVQSYTMRKPIVTNFSIDIYTASMMNLSWYIYWGSENEDWRAGVCYSTATDLPTVDDNIVELEDQEFTINWDTPLASGVYYFRFFVQTARGIGYSPVQRVEITEDMTR